MKRFAGSIALLAVLALGAWLALGEREPRGPAAATGDTAPSAEAQPSPALVDAPEVAPALAWPIEAEPAAPSSREAIAASDERERTRRTHPDPDSIYGRVLWPDGTPAKAWVSAVDESAEKNGNSSTRDDEEQQTSDDGSFQVSGSGAGPFRIHARGEHVTQDAEALDGNERNAHDSAFWVDEQEHVAPGTCDLVLMLSSGLEVSGRLVDERGASVDDFVVYAQRVGRTVPWSNATNTFSRSFQGSGEPRARGFQSRAWELSCRKGLRGFGGHPHRCAARCAARTRPAPDRHGARERARPTWRADLRREGHRRRGSAMVLASERRRPANRRERRVRDRLATPGSCDAPRERTRLCSERAACARARTRSIHGWAGTPSARRRDDHGRGARSWFDSGGRAIRLHAREGSGWPHRRRADRHQGSLRIHRCARG